jgi:hypothetical protein
MLTPRPSNIVYVNFGGISEVTKLIAPIPLFKIFQSVVQPPCAKAPSCQAASMCASGNYVHVLEWDFARSIGTMFPVELRRSIVGCEFHLCVTF